MMKIIVCKTRKNTLRTWMRPALLCYLLIAVPLLLSAWTTPQPTAEPAAEQQLVSEPAPKSEPAPEPEPKPTDPAPEPEPEPTEPTAEPTVYADVPLSEELQAFAVNLCEEQEVPYALVLAVIEHESNFDETATHINADGTTDSGLMQLNDVVREHVKEQYGVTDLLDPKQNLTAGIGILSGYLKKYDTQQAVMAYALGETGMKKARANGRTSTKATDEILALMSKYAAAPTAGHLK